MGLALGSVRQCVKDGLYRVVTPYLCGAFVVERGAVTHCAPILRKKLAYWVTVAERVPATVVNRRVSPFEVYIGRGSKWGNPFSHIPGKGTFSVPTRERAIELYGHYLHELLKDGEVTLEELAELDGKVLGCYCKPQACHGDVLVKASAWAAASLRSLPL